MMPHIGTKLARALGAAPAAPTGGACPQGWGRGCGFVSVLIFSVLAGTVEAEVIAVPSGQPVTLNEVIIDTAPGEPWARFRFLAPDIDREAGLISAEIAAADMDVLCRDTALPYLQDEQLQVARIVISLSDRDVEFGASDPDATQFFEAYRPENARCIWEGF